jgi:hypothetical protein
MAEQIKVHQSETPPSVVEQGVESPLAPENSQTGKKLESHSPVEVISPEKNVSGVLPSAVSQASAQNIADIERILEEDLSEIYFQLPESDKARFRVKGEETAREISTLLSATTIKLKKIIDAIRSWLKLIPGISRFFLEQEAKIKADRLLQLHKDR